MDMFKLLLSSIPPNRSELVNELDLPEVTVSHHIWSEPESLTTSDSIPAGSVEEYDIRSISGISTDSSIPLSRAMTDSEIDYDLYRRFKRRCYSDPFEHMRAVNDLFPHGYLDSLSSYQDTSSTFADDSSPGYREHNEELRLKMEKFFDEECRVYSPDDPGLLELEDALEEIDYKNLYSDLDSVTSS